jgi:hypothetical protein
MKYILPVVLLVIIGILTGSLIYEVHQKNVALGSLQKGWEQTTITTCVRDYQVLARGDIEKAKVDLMLIANVSAKAYVYKYGHEADAKFAPSLSAAFSIYDTYQTTNRAAR